MIIQSASQYSKRYGRYAPLTDDTLVSLESTSRKVLRVSVLLALVQRSPSIQGIVVDGFQRPFTDKDGEIGFRTGSLATGDLGNDVTVDSGSGDYEEGEISVERTCHRRYQADDSQK